MIKDLEGHRTAISVSKDGQSSRFCAPVDLTCDSVAKPKAWIVDPDPAIRAAGLTESFASRNRLACVGGPTGFLTGDDAPRDSQCAVRLCRAEPVVWAGSCDNRKLRRVFRSRNFYPRSVKTRGVAMDPNKLAMQLRECGDHAVTLWLGRSGKSQYAVITAPS